MPVIDEDSIEFLFDCYAWVFRTFGPEAAMEDAVVVLPNRDFFPIDFDGGSATRLAQEVFTHAREHAGLDDWPVRLVRESKPSMLGMLEGTVHAGAEGAVATGLKVEGTDDEPHYVVTYVDDDVRTLDGFIAGIAQQFGEMLAIQGDEEPPGGEENTPYLADVCSVLLGLGVIVTNAAFIFEQFADTMSQGFWYQRRGALSQDELAYALAIFAHLGPFDRKAIIKALDRGPRSTFKRALKDIAKRRGDELARLRGIPPASIGGLSYVPRDGALS